MDINKYLFIYEANVGIWNLFMVDILSVKGGYALLAYDS